MNNESNSDLPAISVKPLVTVLSNTLHIHVPAALCHNFKEM